MELGVEAMQLGLLLLALGDVGVRDEVAHVAAGCVSDRRRGDRDGDELAVLAPPDGLVVVDRLAGQHAREQVVALHPLGGVRHREAGAPEDLVRPPAEDALGRRVPEPDAGVEPELHERERRGVDQGLEPLLLLLALGDVGVGDQVADHAAGPVPHRRGGDRDRDELAVLSPPDGLVVVDRLACPHAHEEVLALRALRVRRHRQPLAAEDLCARPAEDALGGRVPEADAGVEPELHERERRGVDQGLEPVLLLLGCRGIGVGRHPVMDARRR